MRWHTLYLVWVALILVGCETQAGFSPGTARHDWIRDDETTQATFTGGDGLSVQRAVIVDNATEKTGVHAEYIWLHKYYPGFLFRGQGLLNKHGRVYDVMTIVAADGKTLTIFFDTTPYFGKY